MAAVHGVSRRIEMLHRPGADQAATARDQDPHSSLPQTGSPETDLLEHPREAMSPQMLGPRPVMVRPGDPGALRLVG